MFLYFIFVLLAIIAIVVTVKLLHNHQQHVLQERANEDLSLPPVDPDSIPERDGLEWEDEVADDSRAPSSTALSGINPVDSETDAAAPGDALVQDMETSGQTPELGLIKEPEQETENESEPESETVPAPNTDTESDTKSEPELTTESGQEPEPAQELNLNPDSESQPETDRHTDITSEDADKKDWKEHVQDLKNAGQFDDALKACQVGWPQWQSYQQAAIVCRAAFRQPDLPAAEAESWRQALYLLATHASFLHDKVEGMENLSWQRLEKALTVEDLRNLDSNWQEIGYKQLRLLNKTDCRLLSKVWGEPEQHKSAKLYYKNLFLSITSS